MKKILLSACCALAATILLSAQPKISENDIRRAESLVSRMTLEEKCLLVAGQMDGFHTAAITRLGIPAVRMADGPQGVRNKTNSTYYPCGMSLAASWNRDIAYGVGQGIGYDAKARGVRIMLCPGVNIYRSALCGRNFEYYGEDPYLASETALQYINGMQDQNVIATIKHFALNNQEYFRHEVSSNADERTMNEIYFPTFRKAVEKGHVGAVMTSYNPVNGIHAAENKWLIDQLHSWGHEGIVMSDWTSTYTVLGCMQSGLDLEMPQGYLLTYEYIKPLIDKGIVDEKLLDEKCRHILQLFSAYDLLDFPHQDKTIDEDYAPSRANAYAAALEGPVLLKNGGALPILPAETNSIIVLGPNADKVAFGGGSGAMSPIKGRSVTLYDAMKKLGKGYKVSSMNWNNISKEAISQATAVIFAGGFDKDSEGEGHDRKYSLPGRQDKAILALAELNPNVIVVINSGGEFDTAPWIDKVNAVLLAWYGGQAGGQALADLITGKETPSGKLPFTWWGSNEKNPLSAWYETCKPFDLPKRWKDFQYVEYKEGIFVGYRGEKFFRVAPDYPFGYGLSYTRFEYSGICLKQAGDGYDIVFDVANVGDFKGAEIAQVYVAPVSPSVIRPERELKGYAKIRLDPGAKGTVSVHLGPDAFEHYDAASHRWIADQGEYRILVGANVNDIRLESSVVLR